MDGTDMNGILRGIANPNGANLPVFLSATNLSPLISIDLAAAPSEPIIYLTKTGQRPNGIQAVAGGNPPPVSPTP